MTLRGTSPRLLASVFAAVVLATPCARGQALTADHLVVSPTDGHYATVSVKWWQWLYSVPVSRNPIVDTTGRFAAVGQPPGDHFFIGGLVSLNAGLNASATRTITIPGGKFLFFPILNSEQDNLGVTPPNTLDTLRREAASFANSVVTLFATVDGLPVTDLLGYRTISPVFGYVLPNTNGVTDKNLAQFFGVNATGPVFPAVGDGYYLMLKPLHPGLHTVTFGGSTTTTDAQGNPALFRLNITYHIHVLK
jgi:hypothetical protein